MIVEIEIDEETGAVQKAISKTINSEGWLRVKQIEGEALILLGHGLVLVGLSEVRSGDN